MGDAGPNPQQAGLYRNVLPALKRQPQGSAALPDHNMLQDSGLTDIKAPRSVQDPTQAWSIQSQSWTSSSPSPTALTSLAHASIGSSSRPASTALTFSNGGSGPSDDFEYRVEGGLTPHGTVRGFTDVAGLQKEQTLLKADDNNPAFDTQSPAEPVMRKSCQHCRKRKIRCMPSSEDTETCKACLRKHQPCIFQQQSTMGRPPRSRAIVAPPPAARKQAKDASDDLHSAAGKATEGSNAATLARPDDTGTKVKGVPSPASNAGAALAHTSVERKKRKTKRDSAAFPSVVASGIDHGYDSSATSRMSHPTPMLQELPPILNPRSPAEYHFSPRHNNAAMQTVLPPLSSVHSPPQHSWPPFPTQYPQHIHTGPEYYSYTSPSGTPREVPTPYFAATHYAYPTLHAATQILPPHFPALQGWPSSTEQFHRNDIQSTQWQCGPQYRNSSTSYGPGPTVAERSAPEFTARIGVSGDSMARTVSKLSNSRSELPGPVDQPTMPEASGALAFHVSLEQKPSATSVKLEDDSALTAASLRDELHQYRHHTLDDIVNMLYDRVDQRQCGFSVAQAHDASTADSFQAKWPAIAARSIAHRSSQSDLAVPASADYARSLVTGLWQHVPIDSISFVATGRPSQSSPGAKAPRRRPTVDGETSTYLRLLQEDESTTFRISDLADETSPHLLVAADIVTIARYFEAYCARHPFASLLINEKLFKDDLAEGHADVNLLNVIIGSAMARAPCLLDDGGSDSRAVGDRFFAYVQAKVLAQRLDETVSLSLVQTLILWASHEQAHMRTRRSYVLLEAAEIALRFYRAAHNGMQQQPNLEAARWRIAVESELANNAAWTIAMLQGWFALSLKLPAVSLSHYIDPLSLPPANTNVAASFQYAYGGMSLPATDLQHSVRHTIERFSDTAQLFKLIATVKNHDRLRQLFHPEPRKPLKTPSQRQVATLDTARPAAWLVDVAKLYNVSEDTANRLIDALPPGQSPVPLIDSLSRSSRSFMVVASTLLALHQLLPCAMPTGEHAEVGAPSPLPTVDAMKNSLDALQLLSMSVGSDRMQGRSRTQAMLLDAMPRIVDMLDLFSTSALGSLDHFVLVTSESDTIVALLRDLNNAILVLEAETPDSYVTACRTALQRAATALQCISSISTDSGTSSGTGISDGTAQYSASLVPVWPNDNLSTNHLDPLEQQADTACQATNGSDSSTSCEGLQIGLMLPETFDSAGQNVPPYHAGCAPQMLVNDTHGLIEQFYPIEYGHHIPPSFPLAYNA